MFGRMVNQLNAPAGESRKRGCCGSVISCNYWNRREDRTENLSRMTLGLTPSVGLCLRAPGLFAWCAQEGNHLPYTAPCSTNKSSCPHSCIDVSSRVSIQILTYTLNTQPSSFLLPQPPHPGPDLQYQLPMRLDILVGSTFVIRPCLDQASLDRHW